MIEILREKWNKNEELLKQRISRISKGQFETFGHISLVRVAFDTIYNDTYEENKVSIKEITEIEHGTRHREILLFAIPFDKYTLSESDYLMTYVNIKRNDCYTLLNIQNDCHFRRNDMLSENAQLEVLQMCKDIILNTIIPYNN